MVTMAPPPESGGQPASMVEVRVGDKTYPMRSAPACRTCQSRHRLDIEHKILSGYSFKSIADWAAEQDAQDRESGEIGALPPPNVDNLRSHTRAHLPLDATVWRRLIDRRAEELADVLTEGSELIADHVTANRLIVQISMSKLADGSLTPSINDLHAASKFLATHDVAEDDGSGSVAMWRQALIAHLEVARSFIPVADWPQFKAALNSNPILRALTSGKETS